MNLSRAVTTAPGGPPVRRSRWKRRWIAFATCAILLLGTYVFRAAVLRGLANAWIVEDALTPSDAAVLLGGGVDRRPFAAAGLYTNHLVKVILVMQVDRSPTDQLELTRPESEVSRDVLLRLGVPAENIRTVGKAVTSTYEEALAVREWVRENEAKQLIVATDLFHTRRVRWLFTKLLADSGVRVLVQPLDSRGYTRADWWQHEAGLIAFQNEVIKHLLYRWKYF